MAAALLPGLLPPSLLVLLFAPEAAAEAGLRSPRRLDDRCSVSGDDCTRTQCCTEPGMACYEKNEHWASCRRDCTPGSLEKNDPPEHQTPWNCRPLGAADPSTARTTTKAAPGPTSAPATTTSRKQESDSSLADRGFDREVSVGPDVKLHFKTYASEDIRLAIDVPGTGWAALGVGPSMADADTVIGGGSKGGGRPADIGAFTITGRSGSAIRENADATDMLFATEVLHEGGRTKVLFTRPLDNGVTAITLGGITTLVWAYGAGDKIAYHSSNRAAVNIRFLDGGTGVEPVAGGARRDSKIVHAALMFAGWGVLIPLGTLAAAFGGPRFEAGGRAYFNAHRMLQSAGLLAAAAGVIQVVASLYPRDFLGALRAGLLPKHGYLGLAIMLLGAAQPLNALCRPPKEGAWRACWEVWHKSAGRALTMLGLANCVLGSLLARQQHFEKVFTFFLVLSVGFSGVWLLTYLSERYRPKKAGGANNDGEASESEAMMTESMMSSCTDNNSNKVNTANTNAEWVE